MMEPTVLGVRVPRENHKKMMTDRRPEQTDLRLLIEYELVKSLFLFL